MFRYEDFVTGPDRVQQQIAEVIGLQPKAPFSEYPKFISDMEVEQFNDPAYEPRPISTDRIGKSLDLYKTKYPDDVAEFEKCLEQTGYTYNAII